LSLRPSSVWLTCARACSPGLSRLLSPSGIHPPPSLSCGGVPQRDGCAGVPCPTCPRVPRVHRVPPALGSFDLSVVRAPSPVPPSDDDDDDDAARLIPRIAQKQRLSPSCVGWDARRVLTRLPGRLSCLENTRPSLPSL
jgi:hypothetical protein